jgi:antitoxin component HigA of HigAB toxin-antitoxin module
LGIITHSRLRVYEEKPIFGSRGAVSRVLSGTREISKTQAKKLAEYFGMPVGVFV